MARAYAPGCEDIRCRVPDLARVREALGYRPRHGREDVVREVIAWRRGQQSGERRAFGA